MMLLRMSDYQKLSGSKGDSPLLKCQVHITTLDGSKQLSQLSYLAWTPHCVSAKQYAVTAH